MTRKECVTKYTHGLCFPLLPVKSNTWAHCPMKLKYFLLSGNGLLLSKQRRLHSLPHHWCVPCIAWKLALYCVEYVMPCGLPQESLTVLEEPQNLKSQKETQRSLICLSSGILESSINIPKLQALHVCFTHFTTTIYLSITTQLNKPCVQEAWGTRQAQGRLCASSLCLRSLLSSTTFLIITRAKTTACLLYGDTMPGLLIMSSYFILTTAL